MSIKNLQQMHYEAIRLMVLLNTLRSALPDDAAGSETDTRFVVGWAADLASQLANDLDGFDLSLPVATLSQQGGGHE